MGVKSAYVTGDLGLAAFKGDENMTHYSFDEKTVELILQTPRETLKITLTIRAEITKDGVEVILR